MKKYVYISADYAPNNGDQEVVNELVSWGKDDKHKTDFINTAEVASGSVSDDPDCRACDIKKEFNKQINISSSVIIIIGDKTKDRTAGNGCERMQKSQYLCSCTPYKQNTNGSKICKISSTKPADPNGDVGCINSYSYLEHEFREAEKRNKNIIVIYNSLYHEPAWLPSYMSEYEDEAEPFWVKNSWGYRVGNYEFIKKSLGF